jgi:hypothetical protein
LVTGHGNRLGRLTPRGQPNGEPARTIGTRATPVRGRTSGMTTVRASAIVQANLSSAAPTGPRVRHRASTMASAAPPSPRATITGAAVSCWTCSRIETLAACGSCSVPKGKPAPPKVQCSPSSP